MALIGNLLCFLTVIQLISSTASQAADSLFDYSRPYEESIRHDSFFASAAAYCSNVGVLKDFNCGSICTNLTGYQYFNSYSDLSGLFNDLQFVMLFNPSSRTFITAFQGTKNPEQLTLEIIEFGFVPYTLHNLTNSSYILQYFSNYYSSDLRSQVLSALKNAVSQFPDYLFIFTGHSLGGALTTLAGQDAILSGIISKESAVLYTYGSPRVGDFNFASNVDTIFSGVYRVVHFQDVVPHVPPCGPPAPECSISNPFGNYIWPWHVGVQIWYNDDCTSYQTCTGNSGEDPDCSDSVPLAETSITQHTHYFGVHVGALCNTDNQASDSENEGTDNENNEEEFMENLESMIAEEYDRYEENSEFEGEYANEQENYEEAQEGEESSSAENHEEQDSEEFNEENKLNYGEEEDGQFW